MMSRRWIIFIIATSHFFLSQFYRASNAVIAPQLIRDLSLDTAGLGLMSAAFFYGFAIAQIPISLLLDKVGPRLMMTALSLLGILGALVFSMADALGIGLVGRILLGIGMACNLMGTFKLLTEWFEPLIFATLTGVVVSIGTFGNMIAATPLVVLVEQMGWRHSFQLIAGINLMLTVMLFVLLLMNVGIIIGCPLWGALSDRVFKTRKGLIVFCLLLMGLISLVLAIISPETGLFVVASIFFSCGLAASGGMLMYPHIKDLMPQKMAGAAMTGINFFNMMGPAVFLQGLGILMQRLYPDASRGPAAFDAAFLVCMVCLAGSALLYLFTAGKQRNWKNT
jgi:MFS family permease